MTFVIAVFIRDECDIGDRVCRDIGSGMTYQLTSFEVSEHEQLTCRTLPHQLEVQNLVGSTTMVLGSRSKWTSHHCRLSLVGHHGLSLVARCRLILIAFVPVEMVAPVLKPSQS